MSHRLIFMLRNPRQWRIHQSVVPDVDYNLRATADCKRGSIASILNLKLFLAKAGRGVQKIKHRGLNFPSAICISDEIHVLSSILENAAFKHPVFRGKLAGDQFPISSREEGFDPECRAPRFRTGSSPLPSFAATGTIPWFTLSAKATNAWTVRGELCANDDIHDNNSTRNGARRFGLAAMRNR